MQSQADVARWELFDKMPRVGSHSDVGVIELMPTADGEMYGFKYVNDHPKNMAEGLQTVTTFGLLADIYSGYPVMLSEMTVLTALRTAAVSTAPRGIRRHHNGDGAQSEFQCLAQKAVNGITHIRLYDIDPAATAKCMANLAGHGLEVTPCKSPEEAIEGAHIITTAISWPVLLFLSNTRHKRGLRAKSSKWTLITLSLNYGKLSLAKPIGRQSAAEVTLFDGVGFAIEDFSALRYVA